MYQGTNKMALQSQQMIADGLFTLMNEKPFAKVNIKELCDCAKVSRQTFYFLFQTKENVVEWYFDRLFSDFSREPMNTLTQICDKFIDYMLANKYQISCLVKNNLAHFMTQKFTEYLLDFETVVNAEHKEGNEYAAAFLAGALVELIACYLINDANNGGAVGKEYLSNLIEQILTGAYFHL